MGKGINVEFTKFSNLDGMGNEVSATFGYRVYDDYAKYYDNTFDKFEDVMAAVTKDNIYEVVSNCEGFEDSIDDEAVVILNDEVIDNPYADDLNQYREEVKDITKSFLKKAFLDSQQEFC